MSRRIPGLGRVAEVLRDRHAIRRVAAAVRRRVRWARWKAVVLWITRRGVRLEPVMGSVAPDALLVVICLWDRPERIGAIIDQLTRQVESPTLRLVLWNNRPEHDRTYREHFARNEVSGPLASVEYRSSPVNVGGIARFLVARQTAEHGASRPFVMLDDDQDVSPHFIRDMLAAYTPRTYAGTWAFVNVGQYYERRYAEPGEAATYVGTGGSICDTAMVASTRFFDRLPGRFGFVEDLWASYCARAWGWRVVKVDTPVDFVLQERNQYLTIQQIKPLFWDYLESRYEQGTLI